MTQEQLRMQFLSGVITESEYKTKLEEAEPGNLMLSNAAKKIYQYITKNGFKVFMVINDKKIGDKANYQFYIQASKNIGSGDNELNIQGNQISQDVIEKLSKDIMSSFPWLKLKFLRQGVFTLIVDKDANVTESLNEGKDLEKAIKTFEDKIKTFEKELENAKKKIAKEKSKKNPNQETIERYLEDVEFVTDELKKDRQALKSYQKELKSKKESLNEHYVAGGIVGVGAITQIPSREKTDYEMAFEHFLGERYLTNFENREQDIEEGKEVEEPSLYEEELEENIFQGEDVMPKFRAGVLKQLIAYAEKEGSSKESINDLKAALAKIEAEIEAEKNKKPLPR